VLDALRPALLLPPLVGEPHVTRALEVLASTDERQRRYKYRSAADGALEAAYQGVRT
jgi:hypothetical protein